MPTPLLEVDDHADLKAALPAVGLTAETRGRGWPVRLLPADHLAADLALLGVTHRRGYGFARNGERLDSRHVGVLIADVLEQLAARLADVREAEEQASEDLRRGRPLRAPLLGGVPNALDRTAIAIRSSRKTAEHAADHVSAHLPAPAGPTRDATLVDAFLARLDDTRRMKRSDLARRYTAAGRPGDFDDSELRDRAVLRWGDARRVSGDYYLYPHAPADEPSPLLQRAADVGLGYALADRGPIDVATLRRALPALTAADATSIIASLTCADPGRPAESVLRPG